MTKRETRRDLPASVPEGMPLAKDLAESVNKTGWQGERFRDFGS